MVTRKKGCLTGQPLPAASATATATATTSFQRIVAVTGLAKRFIWLAAESRSKHRHDMVRTSNIQLSTVWRLQKRLDRCLRNRRSKQRGELLHCLHVYDHWYWLRERWIGSNRSSGRIGREEEDASQLLDDWRSCSAQWVIQSPRTPAQSCATA